MTQKELLLFWTATGEQNAYFILFIRKAITEKTLVTKSKQLLNRKNIIFLLYDHNTTTILKNVKLNQNGKI